MRKYFIVNGYWKNDLSEFSDYVITDFDDCPENVAEDSIFFFGLSETAIKENIQMGIDNEESALDFVITSYVEITNEY